MRKSMVFAAIAAMCIAGAAQATLVDDFDSYASQAAFEAVWTPMFAGSSLGLLQGYDHTTGSTNSVNGVATANSTMRNQQDFAGLEGSDAQPLKYEFWMELVDPANTGARNYNELRSINGTGGLDQLIAMGAYNGVDATKWSARVTYGGAGWQPLTIARSAGWHKLTAMIKSSTIEFYVDDQLGGTWSYTPRVFNRVVLGSGLTSNGNDAATDDLCVMVVPEPATLVMLAMGGLVALRRRSA